MNPLTSSVFLYQVARVMHLHASQSKAVFILRFYDFKSLRFISLSSHGYLITSSSPSGRLLPGRLQLFLRFVLTFLAVKAKGETQLIADKGHPPAQEAKADCASPRRTCPPLLRAESPALSHRGKAPSLVLVHLTVQSLVVCSILCDPMDHSTPSSSVLQNLLEFAQTQRPLSPWCRAHPAISSGATPFLLFCLQFSPASGPFFPSIRVSFQESAFTSGGKVLTL